MKEDLIRYMSNRSKGSVANKITDGPVVTISREKGCPANSIAEKLSKSLSGKTHGKSWRWVNKLILEESAKELHMNPSKINHVLYSEDKGFVRDLILSFGERYYESDVKVKKTLAGLISEFSVNGKVIIVGLGGVAITRDIKSSLHIKLYAPQKYRVKQVMKQEKMSFEKALDYTEETDVNRKMLIDYFNGLKANNNLFHAQFNCLSMSEDEIVSSIVDLMKLKHLI